ncbi:MAG: putative Phenylacetate-CoA ligase [Candidatus Thorarchaeota archaeon]|nr:MAG: putative Phenylacetate-CoA ligase [Candidatus Thorarchaeota archaeon]
MKTTLRETVYIRMYELVTRRNIWKPLKSLSESQWYTPKEIRQLQEEKLLLLMHHAYETVPWYRKVFNQMDIYSPKQISIESFEEMPILKKRILQLHYPQKLLSRHFDRQGGFEDRTGGTTGGPTRYFVGPKAAGYRAANATRNQHWYNYFHGQSNALIWGAERDLSSDNIQSRIFQQLSLNRIEMNAWDMTETQMRKFAIKVQKQRPRILAGYAGAVAIFAKFTLENNIDLKFDSGIVVSGELLTDQNREIIETAFGSKIFNRYGTREFGSIAHECSCHDGLHINGESFIIEQGEKYDDGYSLLVTDLNNFAMPMIRYEIGDVGLLSTRKCKCGRGLPLLETILGRTTSYIITPQGSYVNGIVFPHLLRDYGEILEFRVIQQNIDEIDIFLVLKNPLDEKQKESIRRRLSNFLQSIRINLIEVDKISLADSGKRDLVTSKLVLEMD